MYSLILIIHILVCLAIIFVILLQKSKGAEMGAAFGGSSQTIFGSSGAMTFLNKLTTIVAVMFMVTSLALAHMAAPKKVESILDEVTTEQAPSASESPAESRAATPSLPAVDDAQAPAAQPIDRESRDAAPPADQKPAQE